jgi:hypothetical protein
MAVAAKTNRDGHLQQHLTSFTLSADVMLLATFTADFRHMATIATDCLTTLAANFRHMAAVTTNRLASTSTDFRHMLTITTYSLTTLTRNLLPRFWTSRSKTALTRRLV